MYSPSLEEKATPDWAWRSFDDDQHADLVRSADQIVVDPVGEPVEPTSAPIEFGWSRSKPFLVAAAVALLVLTLVTGWVLQSSPDATSHVAERPTAVQVWEGSPDQVLQSDRNASVEVELASFTPARTGWAADTARFAGCLGGFGFVAAPIVAGFMFGGGPKGAIAAAKAWIPRLGPVGTGIMKWCMQSVLGVRM